MAEPHVVAALKDKRCARRSWRVPAGGSPARVRAVAGRPVASVAGWKVTTTAKRTQRSSGVGY